MIKKIRSRKAGSAIEYMALIIFLLGALLVFKRYILRGFWGQWKKAGDVFGHGKQYDPRGFEDGGTLQCIFVYDCYPDGICVNSHGIATFSESGTWVVQPGYDECMVTPGKTRQACINANSDESGFCVKNF